MEKSVHEQAKAALKEVEAISAVVLPEPTAELIPLATAEAPVAADIRKRMDEIDLNNTDSIIAFGSATKST